MKNTALLTAALTLSLSLTACGGSVNSPEAPTMASSSLGALTTPGSTALSPIESLDDAKTPEEPAAEAPAAEAAPEAEAPTTETPAETPAAEAPATETPASEAPASEAPAAPTDEIPDMEVQTPYVPAGSSLGGGSSYSADGKFKVDQDTFNQWQPVGLTSDGSSLYVAAVDVKTPTKGTVIQMDTAGGNWKDLGKSLLSTILLGAAGYKMPQTLQGITLDDSGNLLIADTQNQLFRMETPKYATTAVQAPLSGVLDITSAGGNVFVASSTGLQKFDPSLSAGSAFSQVVPTGGIGHDSQGNVYAVVNNAIQKINSNGEASEVVKNLSAPLDVAVDSQGNIFVLQSDTIRYFKASGESLGSFGSGEFTAPKSLFVAADGTVYVADAGTSYKDAQVVKFIKG